MLANRSRIVKLESPDDREAAEVIDPAALGLVRRILLVSRRCRDPASAAFIPGPGPASGPPRATGGSGRTSPAAAPARRAPAPAGCSTASSRAS